MKIKFYLVIFFLLVYMGGFSQTEDELNEKLDGLAEAIANLQKAIKDDKEEKDTACVIFIKKFDSIILYNNDEDSIGSISIKSVVFDIKDGLILDMQVVTDENLLFSNYRAPIGLTRFDRCDWLSYYRVKGKKSEHVYINTCEFSYILRKGVVVPDNAHFTLTRNDSSKVLSRSSGINQIIDIRFYSDLLGALVDQPNGIVQMEGNTRIFINNRNLISSLTPFRYGYFSVQASKLDSKFQVLQVDSTFSRIRAIQRSALSIDLGVNLFGFWLQKKSRSWGSLNGGAGLNLTQLGAARDTTLVSSQYLFLEALFEFKELKNFGIDFTARAMWQTVPGLGEEIGNTQALMRIGASAYWSPMNNNNRIFTRVNYFQNLDKSEEPFVQLQLGYSAVIGKLLPTKK